MRLNKNKIAIFGSGQLAKSLSMIFKNKSLTFNKNNLNILLPENEIMMKLHFLLDNQNIFCLINCIAINDIEFCENNQDIANKINVIFPKILAQYCALKNIALIHFSCYSVFNGIETNKFYNENDIKNPVNYYGKTKSDSEDIVLKNCTKHFIFRLPPIYSIFFNNNIVLQTINLLNNSKQITAPKDQYGSILNVFDIAKIIENIIFKIEQELLQFQDNINSKFGIYNLTGNGNILSKYEIVDLIFNIINKYNSQYIQSDNINIKSILFNDLKLKHNVTKNFILDNSKFRLHFPQIKLPDWIFSLQNAIQKICLSKSNN